MTMREKADPGLDMAAVESYSCTALSGTSDGPLPASLIRCGKSATTPHGHRRAPNHPQGLMESVSRRFGEHRAALGVHAVAEGW